jgi:hypothetical protein
LCANLLKAAIRALARRGKLNSRVERLPTVDKKEYEAKIIEINAN